MKEYNYWTPKSSMRFDETEEDRLDDALFNMERKNPSISRIREKINPSYNNSVVIGRDFETNQKLYKENEELSNELKRKLDDEIYFDMDRIQMGTMIDYE